MAWNCQALSADQIGPAVFDAFNAHDLKRLMALATNGRRVEALARAELRALTRTVRAVLQLQHDATLRPSSGAYL